MKKVLLLALLAYLTACNNQPAATAEAPKPAPDSAATVAAEIKFPYQMGY